jgi:hypothetical protein
MRPSRTRLDFTPIGDARQAFLPRDPLTLMVVAWLTFLLWRHSLAISRSVLLAQPSLAMRYWNSPNGTPGASSGSAVYPPPRGAAAVRPGRLWVTTASVSGAGSGARSVNRWKGPVK